MNSLERVLTTLGHKEPDFVPVFLFFTVHGAKELGLTFSEYYKSGKNIANAQLKLQEKFNHDCLYPFFYAGIEFEAFGGKVIFNKNGPPASGKPIFNNIEELLAKELPSLDCEAFKPILEAQNILFEKKGDELPIVNSIVAPFSLPIMLLGFEKWIDYIVNYPEDSKEVVSYLTDYSISLTNFLLENNATAIGYFNPLASPEIVDFDKEYKIISYESCKKYFNSIKGPGIYAVAGSRVESIISSIINLKAVGVVISSNDNLRSIKNKFGSKINILGNFNNIEMLGWDEKQTYNEIKRCIEEAASGGGYIISDHHGDLPLGISDETLHNILKVRNDLGKY